MAEVGISPPAWRVGLAFLLAPAAAALVCACLFPLYPGSPDLAGRIWLTSIAYLLFGGYPAAIVLGLPAFFVLRDRIRFTLLNCAIVGTVVGGAPWIFLSLLSSVNYRFGNGHVTDQSGMTTLWGWLDLGVFVLQFAGLGGFGGLVFWAVAALDVRDKA